MRLVVEADGTCLYTEYTITPSTKTKNRRFRRRTARALPIVSEHQPQTVAARATLAPVRPRKRGSARMDR
jgi:hypothetical protein